MAKGKPHRSTFERARSDLATRLRERRGEIEQAVVTRVFALSNGAGPLDHSQIDPGYLEGLRSSVRPAVDFGLDVIERGEERSPPPPPLLLAQARLAARHHVGLDTVLRRYSAGYVLLSDFLIEEALRSGLRGADLQRLLRSQAALDRLLAAVSEEYVREKGERPGTSEQRRAERIERLLAGELLDVSGIAYDFEGFHCGLIGVAPTVVEMMRRLAVALDCRLLTVVREEGAVWAWLGSRRPLDDEKLERLVGAAQPADAVLAIGETGDGMHGWRLTHRQARAALPISLRSAEPFVRYADVALLASTLQDDLLATSLHHIYLRPLEAERDGGEALCRTLQAYFTAERNVSSAAATLGLSRQAVAKRLRVAEQRLGRPLPSCGLDLEVALRLRQHLSHDGHQADSPSSRRS